VFKKLPFILLILIATTLIINPFLPVEVKQYLYAISLSVKSLILLILPFVIFSLLFSTISSLSRGATNIIGLILLALCCSNFISTFLSHYVGAWIYNFDLTLITPKEASGLQPAFIFELPKLIANDKAMFAGIISALVLGRFKPNLTKLIATKLDWFASKILNSFAILVTLFVLGFLCKMQNDGIIQLIIRDYSKIFLVVISAQIGYLLFTYAALNLFNPRKTFNSIKNILPAALAGFTTMSSAAVMPLTIMGAEQNAKNKKLSKSVIPLTVNIHLVGDCIAIPIFAYAVLKSFGMPAPELMQYIIFVMYFVIAKFSVAAIPGGGIIVMLPILEGYLGFNGEMLSLITALYILFDPVITSANVLGNGMFAKLIDNLMGVSFKGVKASGALPQES